MGNVGGGGDVRVVLTSVTLVLVTDPTFTRGFGITGIREAHVLMSGG